MTMAFNPVVEQQLDDNAITSPGAKLRFYDVGTTTPRLIYSDAARTIARAQPVIADSAGRWPQIFLQDGVYKYTIHDANDVPIGTPQDNVDPGFSGGVGAVSISGGGTGANNAATARSNLGVPSLAVTTAIDGRLSSVEGTLAAPLKYPVSAETFASPFIPNFTTYQVISITLTGGITINQPSSVGVGASVTIILIQDATGGRSVVWDSAYRFPGGVPPPASTIPNAVDVYTFYAKTASLLECVSSKIQQARRTLINSAYASIATVDSTATALPFDDTIPTNTEGKEMLTVDYAAASPTSVLQFEVTMYLECNTNFQNIVAALFKGTDAAASAVGVTYCASNGSMVPVVIRFEVAAGSTTNTTWRIRCGAATGTVTLNGTGAARKYGGVLKSSISITELRA